MSIETKKPIRPVEVEEKWKLIRDEFYGMDRFIDPKLDLLFEKEANKSERPGSIQSGWWLLNDLIKQGETVMAAKVLNDLPFRSEGDLRVIENLSGILRGMDKDGIKSLFKFYQRKGSPFSDYRPIKAVHDRYFAFRNEVWSVVFYFMNPEIYPEPDSFLKAERLDDYRRKLQ